MNKSTDSELLDIIETQGDLLKESFNRLVSLEDQVFILLKIINHIGGDENQMLAGGLKISSQSRREAGETEIADLTDDIIAALLRQGSPTKN